MPSGRGARQGRILRDRLEAGAQIVIRYEQPWTFAELCEVDGEDEIVIVAARGIGPQAALEGLARKLSVVERLTDPTA